MKHPGVLEAMQELSSAMTEVQEAWLIFLQAQIKAKGASQKLISMIDEITKQPNIEIKDYEIDG